MVELRTGNSVSFLFDSQAMIRPSSPESQLQLWVANSESGGKQSSSDSKVVSRTLAGVMGNDNKNSALMHREAAR